MRKDTINLTLIAICVTVVFSICWVDLYLLKKYFPQDDNQEKIEVLEKENHSLKDKLFDCQIREKVHL
jgi:hypothetical protein